MRQELGRLKRHTLYLGYEIDGDGGKHLFFFKYMGKIDNKGTIDIKVYGMVNTARIGGGDDPNWQSIHLFEQYNQVRMRLNSNYLDFFEIDFSDLANQVIVEVI